MDDDDEAIYSEAIHIANEIEAIVRGRPTAAVFVALGKIIGAATADSENPNLCGLMELISGVAHNELGRRLEDAERAQAH